MKSVIADKKKLEAAIEASSLTLEAIAEKSAVDNKTLYNIRQGRETKIATLGRIARALNTNLIDLSAQGGNANSEIPKYEVEIAFIEDELDATRYHAELIAERAGGTGKVVWHLGLSQLEQPQADAIYEVTKIVDDMANYRSESFSWQVTMALRTTALKEAIQQLEAFGIGILGAYRKCYSFEFRNPDEPIRPDLSASDQFRIFPGNALYLVFEDLRVEFAKIVLEEQYSSYASAKEYVESLIESARKKNEQK